MHPATDDHVRFAIKHPTLHKSAGMILKGMAGPATNPVQVFRTGRANHWEFSRLWTGFELPSSWLNLPCDGLNLNRKIL
jgi:hypothetical protein